MSECCSDASVTAAPFSLPTCRLLRGGEEESVDGVNIYPGEERAQHSAEATDDFKMSFSSSLPRNSAAALKKKQIPAFKSQPPQTPRDAPDSKMSQKQRGHLRYLLDNPLTTHEE